MHGRLEFLVAIPVAVGLLDYDAALEQQAFQHLLYVKGSILGIADAQCDILEVAEQCHVAGFCFLVHFILCCFIGLNLATKYALDWRHAIFICRLRVVLNQVRDDHLQCHAMQEVFGLDVLHLIHSN